jgi:hypothetical protein
MLIILSQRVLQRLSDIFSAERYHFLVCDFSAVNISCVCSLTHITHAPALTAFLLYVGHEMKWQIVCLTAGLSDEFMPEVICT